MALIGNYSLSNRTVYKQFTGGVASGYVECTNPNGALKNRFFGGFNPKNGMFTGYLHPMSFVLPVKPGAMRLIGSSTSTGLAIGAAGRGIVSSGAGVSAGLTTAQAIVQIITSGSATSTGSALAAAVINLITSGSATSSGATLLGAIINIETSGASASSGQTLMTAIGHIVTEAGGPTPLSPEGLAEAVWNYLKANPTTSGSMKEVLEKAKQSADNAFAVSS